MFKKLLLLALLPALAYADGNCQRSSTHNENLINNLDGTITDTQTRLMWKQCSEGQSGDSCEEGKAKAYNWLATQQVPDQVNSTGGFADYTDWRLPTTFELMSLLDKACSRPAVDLALFPATPSPSWYWATSPLVGFEEEGSLISFDFSGNMNGTTGNTSGKIRLVRDAK